MRKLRDYYDPEPSYEPPEGKPMPVCPCCGEDADTFYLNPIGEIVGCDVCLWAKNAREVSA